MNEHDERDGYHDPRGSMIAAVLVVVLFVGFVIGAIIFALT